MVENEQVIANIKEGAVGIKLNSPYGKILYIVLLSIVALAFISIFIITHSYVLGFFFALMLFCGIYKFVQESINLLKKHPWMFVERELILPLYDRMLFGQQGRQEQIISELPIEKQTVERTISAKARVVKIKVKKLRSGQKEGKV